MKKNLEGNLINRNIAINMGKTKSGLFSERHNRLAKMAKALAHPARVAILEALVRRGSCVCGDLVDELPLSQATVSQHLKAMKEAGLIKGEIEGQFTCYCVDKKACQEAWKALGGMLEVAG
ncbi:MAG TPA: metalloregulator ArsR/SmtB family transcription factor, partial [Flavilitoribacter sp.]|nr:metalloregulator ArsR/SmtB family transcription factor [Flavilitoribacter sp.]